MKTIFEHIEYAKGKPHHIRKRIALIGAAGVAGFIGLIWFVGSISTGSFAIAGSNFADSVGQGATVTTVPADQSSSAELAGAAAAPAVKTNAPAHIEIIDTSATTSKQKAEATVLPF